LTRCELLLECLAERAQGTPHVDESDCTQMGTNLVRPAATAAAAAVAAAALKK